MLPEGLDLRKLRAFQLVARHGGLRAAARRLRITVPAVSFLIRKLEHELGMELFQRLPRGLALTQAGENLLRASTVIFEEVEGALAILSERGRLEGQLSIITSSDSVSYFTPKITAFMKRHSSVEVRHHIHTSEYTLRLVNSGAFDVGLGEFPKRRSGLVKETVVVGGLTLLCLESDILFGKSGIRLPELSKSRLILPSGQSWTRKAIELTFAKAGTKCADIIEAGGCHTARDFVRSGIGAALVHTVCANRMSLRGLRQIDVSSQFPKIEFSAIYRRDASHSPLIHAFIEELAVSVTERPTAFQSSSL